LEMESRELFPGLVLNCNSPNLSLPNSYDYKHEPPVPGLYITLYPWFSIGFLNLGTLWSVPAFHH
jgi:hypothetical protein